MKWIVRKEKFALINDPGKEKFFEEIDLALADGDPDLPKELFKLGFIEWVTYPGPDNDFNPLPKIEPPSRRKYEIFCGGFLHYHDQEFKKYSKGRGYTDEKGDPEWKQYPDTYKGPDDKEYKSVDFKHKIYFEWFNLKDQDRVRIYINRTPPELNTNPPRPPAPPPPES